MAATPLDALTWPRFVQTFEWLSRWTVDPGVSFLPGVFALDFFGAVLVCRAFYEHNHKQPTRTLYALFACFVLQFGGTTLSNVVVLGQTPGWLTTSTSAAALVLAFWLTFCCPFGLWRRACTAVPGVLLLCELLSAASGAHAVTTWGVDTALHARDPRAAASATAALLCGALSACGGGLLGRLAGFLPPLAPAQQRASTRATALHAQRVVVYSAVYYALIDPHRLLANSAFLTAGPVADSLLATWLGAFAGDRVTARALLGVLVLLTCLWDHIVGGPTPLDRLVLVAVRLFNVGPFVGGGGSVAPAGPKAKRE